MCRTRRAVLCTVMLQFEERRPWLASDCPLDDHEVADCRCPGDRTRTIGPMLDDSCGFIYKRYSAERLKHSPIQSVSCAVLLSLALPSNSPRGDREAKQAVLLEYRYSTAGTASRQYLLPHCTGKDWHLLSGCCDLARYRCSSRNRSHGSQHYR
jgi:hypothetical protein